MARTSRTSPRDETIIRNIWQTAFYIRLSREDGNDESYSVKNQRQRLLTYFETALPHEEMNLVDTYVDDGYTGTDSDRDNFQRMLSDISAKRINCVIVKDLSRLSRNDWECKRYLQHFFVVKDVRFISLELPAMDSFKRPDEVYELGVSIQSMYNENHCRETSIKVRGTFNTKREKGEFIGAFAPYGYQKDPADKHHLIIDEEAACVVRDIFHWFVREGMSKNGIVKRLLSMGIPCPAAYKRQKGMNYCNPHIDHNPLWAARSITTILTNQMYLGHMVQGKQKIKSYKIHTRVKVEEEDWFIKEDMHDPIMDQETFVKAQELMRRDTRTAPKSGQLYTFSGFLRCADCGKAICRRTSKNIVYYACQTYTTRRLCSRHSIRHDKLESMILAAIRTQVALMDDIAALIDEVNHSPAARNVSRSLENVVQQRRQELDKLTKRKADLYMDWKNEDITRDEYHDMKKSFEEREQKVRKDIVSLEIEAQDITKEMSPRNSYFEAFAKHRNITQLDRGIVVELIKAIHIQEGGDITIDFNFADQHKLLLEQIEDRTNAVDTVKEALG
jgi:DNA invertase Pin-like site-specific DNA recombinase